MDVLYSIKDWGIHYENAASKQVRNLHWVKEPNGAQSSTLDMGIKRLLRSKGGVAAYGIYELLVKQASRCQPRGKLSNAAGPLSVDDLEMLIWVDSGEINAALELLTSERIGLVDRIGQGNQADAGNGGQGPAEASQGVEAVEFFPGIDQDSQYRADHNAITGWSRVKQDADSGLSDSQQDADSGLSDSQQDADSPIEQTSKREQKTTVKDTKPNTKGKKKKKKKKKNSKSGSNSDSESPRRGIENQDDETKRKISFMRWKLSVTPIFGTFRQGDGLGKEPKQSAQYRGDVTSSENLFNELIWPEGKITVALGRTRLKTATDLIEGAKRNGDSPMAWLTKMCKRELKNGIA